MLQLNDDFLIHIQNPYDVTITKAIKEILKTIDKNDKDVCLNILSYFVSPIIAQHRESENIKPINASKIVSIPLNANELKKKIGEINCKGYKYYIDLLKDIGIIEMTENYYAGVHSRRYKIKPELCDSKLIKMKIVSDKAKKIAEKNYRDLLSKALRNPVASKLISSYAHIELPSKETILTELDKFISKQYHYKKLKPYKDGKILYRVKKKNKAIKGSDIYDRTIKHNKQNPKNKYKLIDAKKHLNLYYNLVGRGVSPKAIIPLVSGDKAGGRIIDSFTLMPKWIRKLIKIDGEPIVELDYSALHPNLLPKIYDSKIDNPISHDDVLEYFQNKGMVVTRNKIKIEHLSFFNKRIQGMKKSVLWNYYQEQYPEMMDKVIADKENSEFGHKVTSRKLFKNEVQLMTLVIEKIKKLYDLPLIYCHDTLYIPESRANEVRQIMNKQAGLFGILAKVG